LDDDVGSHVYDSPDTPIVFHANCDSPAYARTIAALEQQQGTDSTTQEDTEVAQSEATEGEVGGAADVGDARPADGDASSYYYDTDEEPGLE
jgi:hypothetical protein